MRLWIFKYKQPWDSADDKPCEWTLMAETESEAWDVFREECPDAGNVTITPVPNNLIEGLECEYTEDELKELKELKDTIRDFGWIATDVGYIEVEPRGWDHV